MFQLCQLIIERSINISITVVVYYSSLRYCYYHHGSQLQLTDIITYLYRSLLIITRTVNALSCLFNGFYSLCQKYTGSFPNEVYTCEFIIREHIWLIILHGFTYGCHMYILPAQIPHNAKSVG